MEDLSREQKINLLKLARKTIYELLYKNKFDGAGFEEFTDNIFKTK